MMCVTETWSAACLPQNESVVTVRPIQPADAGLVDEMYWRLSSETVYFRYFEYGIPKLVEIEQLCRITPEQGAGFVATVQNQGEVAVGIAYYRREHGPFGCGVDQTVEFNLLVEAQYQMQGVVPRLWQHIHDHAKARQGHALDFLFSPTSQRIWMQIPRVTPAPSQE